MAGLPQYPLGIDTDATLGPTASIVPGFTTLAAGDELGILKNLITASINLQTVVGIPGSAVTSSHDFKITSLQAPATATTKGLVPIPPNDPSKFLRGDAQFAVIPPANAGVLGLGPSVDVQAFTTPGPFTWNKPTVGTPVWVEVICIGGGGAGGAGGYAATSTAVGGGGGGCGGNWSHMRFPASSLGSSVSGNVGAGMTGGASQTTVGQPGASPGNRVMATNDSWFGSATVTNDQLCQASGGNSGGGGPISASGGTGGSANNIGIFNGAAGGAGSANGGTSATGGNQTINSSSGGAGGGGGGGGFSTGNAEVVGGLGSHQPSWMGARGGGSAGNIHAAGGNGDIPIFSAYLPGAGGGGGGSSKQAGTVVWNGGNGGNYGGGGGGGGAGNSTSATGSGAGGNGANGVCVVTTYF